MAILVAAQKPQELLEKLREKVRTGAIGQWQLDGDEDFKMAWGDIRGCGWLRPTVNHGSLAFGLLGAKGSEMTRAAYAQYHSLFSAMLLAHFDGDFLKLTITAKRDDVYDKF
jgi:hypothetical protein